MKKNRRSVLPRQLGIASEYSVSGIIRQHVRADQIYNCRLRVPLDERGAPPRVLSESTQA